MIHAMYGITASVRGLMRLMLLRPQEDELLFVFLVNVQYYDNI